MKELKTMIDELKVLQERYDKVKKIKNGLHSDIYQLEEKICNFMAENSIKEIELDSMTIKTEFSQSISILGGEQKNPEIKTGIVKDLIELGYLDEDKVKYFEAVAVNTNTLNASLKKLDLSQITKYQQEKKISLSFLPKVSVK